MDNIAFFIDKTYFMFSYTPLATCRQASFCRLSHLTNSSSPQHQNKCPFTSTTMPTIEEPQTSTKAKLDAVIGTFQEFDTTMRIGTR